MTTLFIPGAGILNIPDESTELNIPGGGIVSVEVAAPPAGDEVGTLVDGGLVDAGLVDRGLVG